MLTYFGVSEGDSPTARLINMETGKKFSIKSDNLTTESLLQLCQEVLAGTAKVAHVQEDTLRRLYTPLNLCMSLLQPYFKSEEIPEDWNKGPVKVLVGKNFEAVALDPTKNVFVEFCKTPLT